MDTTTYSKYVMSHATWTQQQPTVNMSCHMDTTIYSKYVMWKICHATWTQQPTVNMSCHMDTTTYSEYAMPHGHNNIQ